MNTQKKDIGFVKFFLYSISFLLIFSFIFVDIFVQKTLASSDSNVVLAQYNPTIWGTQTQTQTTGFNGYGVLPNYNTYQNPSYSTNGTTNGLADWNIFDANGAYNPTPAPTIKTGTITGNASVSAGAVITPNQQAQTGPDESGNCGIKVSSDQWTYCMLTPVGGLLGSPTSDQNGKTEAVSLNEGLQPFFAKIYKIGIGVAIALAIVMISFGGIRMATTDSVSAKDDGKKMINAAFAGLFLALFSYVLLYTINPALLENGKDFFNTATKAPTVSGGTNPVVVPGGGSF